MLHPWCTAALLLRLSERYVYRALWSQDVLDETRRSLIQNAGLTVEQAEHRIAQMKAAFPEALVTGYDDIVPAMRNHEGDRHVLAAAIVGKADVIVTDNVTHFPESICGELDLDVQTADQFLMHSLALSRRRCRCVPCPSRRLPPSNDARERTDSCRRASSVVRSGTERGSARH